MTGILSFGRKNRVVMEVSKPLTKVLTFLMRMIEEVDLEVHL